MKDDPRINREGRPEGSYSLLTILKQELQKCPEGQDKKSYGELIVRRMLKEAIEKGDVQQIKLIWNYIEGMPFQPIGGKDGNAIKIVIQDYDDVDDNNKIAEKTEDISSGG